MDTGIDIGYNNDTRKEQLLVFRVGRELLRIRGRGSALLPAGGDGCILLLGKLRLVKVAIICGASWEVCVPLYLCSFTFCFYVNWGLVWFCFPFSLVESYLVVVCYMAFLLLSLIDSSPIIY